MTGNVERFVNKLGMKNVRVNSELTVEESFVLITYTIKFGEIPQSTVDFLKVNSTNLIAVASSGNKIWGNKFAIAADLIAEKYNVPIILKFELSGNEKDKERFIQEVRHIDQRTKMDSKK